VAVLVNPAFAAQSELALRELQPAARAIGVQIQVLNAGTRQEIDAAFTTIGSDRPDALFVTSDTFFTSRRVQLVNLATRYAIPTAFPNRESAEIAG